MAQTKEAAETAMPMPLPFDQFEEHRQALVRYAGLLGADAASAEELVQDVLVAVWSRRDAGGRVEQPFAYLRTAVRHRFVDRARHEEARHRALDPSALEAVDRVWDERCGGDGGDAYFDAVAACLAELTPRARRAVLAAHVDGRPRAEVARELGLRRHGFKSLLQRAMRALRVCVERKSKS